MQIPRAEYPRPQFVREKWMNLNGLWEYAITPIAWLLLMAYS